MDEHSFSPHLRAGRLFLGAVTVMLLGISQLIFGWMGSGFLYRVAYPVALMLVSLFIFWMARGELSDDDDEEEETSHQ